MRHLGLPDMRTGGVAAQAPIESHRQAASDGHFRHLPAPPELQTLILAPQRGSAEVGVLCLPLRRFFGKGRLADAGSAWRR
jgi:hypothetical protein